MKYFIITVRVEEQMWRENRMLSSELKKPFVVPGVYLCMNNS